MRSIFRNNLRLKPSILTAFFVLTVPVFFTIIAVTYFSNDNIARTSARELVERFRIDALEIIEDDLNPLKSLIGSAPPQTTAARLRYTAPFDMSGHPTLTLPGGVTSDGVPVGFQIVGRAFNEAGILAAGHAYQQVTDWHLKRPPL